ncbi:MAG: ABC transporter permease subunit [Roseburia sp.]|nr:ABC transporter permease subunit [Roseburia sp.]
MRKIGILAKKEIMEILRDKKTLIIMIVMPMLLYPIILIGMSLGMAMIMQSQMEDVHTVAYRAEDEAYVSLMREIYEENREELDFELVWELAGTAESDAQIRFSEDESGIHVKVDYSSASQGSDYTERVLEELADLYREKLLLANLEREGLEEDFLYPVTYESADAASVSESVGLNIGGAIGMLLITMILLGAFYPAVDVTTGEKERGTLETLLTLPVTNFQMIMSKYIAISLFACVTAIVSVISLGGSVLFLMFGLPAEYTGEMGQIPVGTFLSYIPMLLAAVIATAMLITAICMCFCIFAKSTKEANNYMTPIMLVIMFASMVGMVPTVMLDYKLSLIPLVNVSLLIKQVLAQQVNWALAGITILVNVGYSIVAIWIIAKMYDSEDILFTDGFHSFRVLQKRSEIHAGTVPATGDLFMSIAVVLLGMIYIGNIVGVRSLFAGTVVNQLLILAVPLLLTWYMKSDRRTLFHLRRPKAVPAVGGFLFYIGTYVVVILASAVLAKIFPESAQNVDETFDVIMQQPFVLLVLVVALMPAIGEELMFRGLIFGSLRDKWSAGWAVLLSGLIFGLFHMSLVKLIPTALLGICFAVIVEKGGSIFVTMLTHFVNNLLAVIAMCYPQAVERALPFLTMEQFTAPQVCIMAVIAAVCLASGYILLSRPVKLKN